jgi:uncharacterized membrane protein
MGLINIRYVGKKQKPQRIEALSDGVFAIVMTILVLELALEGGADSLSVKLTHMIPELYLYFLTFISIGASWMIHYYQFYYIRRVDSISMWINILFLATVALTPFSYSLLLTDYISFVDQQIALRFFAGNTLIAILLLLIHWIYATRKYYLIDRKEVQNYKIITMRNLLLFGISIPIIAIGLSYINNELSGILFSMLSLIYLILIIVIGKDFGRINEEQN